MAEDFKDLTPKEVDEEVYENYGGKICLVPDYASNNRGGKLNG